MFRTPLRASQGARQAARVAAQGCSGRTRPLQTTAVRFTYPCSGTAALILHRYRFVSRGLVNEVHVGSRCVFYDNNMEPHHHIYDEDTGVLCDLNLSKVQCVVDPDSLPSGTVQVGTDVTIRVRRKHSP